MSLNEIIAKLEALIGRKAEIDHKTFHKADIKTTSADITKAKELLGWNPVVELDDGLKACVDWHNNNKPWSQQIVLP